MARTRHSAPKTLSHCLREVQHQGIAYERCMDGLCLPEQERLQQHDSHRCPRRPSLCKGSSNKQGMWYVATTKLHPKDFTLAALNTFTPWTARSKVLAFSLAASSLFLTKDAEVAGCTPMDGRLHIATHSISMFNHNHLRSPTRIFSPAAQTRLSLSLACFRRHSQAAVSELRVSRQHPNGILKGT